MAEKYRGFAGGQGKLSKYSQFSLYGCFLDVLARTSQTLRSETM